VVSDRYSPFSTYAPQPQPWGRGSTCTHVAPDACPDCDGSNPWKSARIPETLPPCMTPDYDEKASA
jgi:hypothetical protein